MQRTRYIQYEADFTGQSRPGSSGSDGSRDSHLEAVKDEAAAALSHVESLRRLNDGQAPQTSRLPSGGYEITHDPNYDPGSHISKKDFAKASILHEAMHVAVDKKYQTPDDGPDYRLYNMHLPVGSEEQIATSYTRQVETIRNNLEGLRSVADRDPWLSDNQKKFVNGRVDYAQYNSHVHYDTVLVDIVSYLKTQGASKTETYKHVRALSKEAEARRNGSTGGHHEVQPYQQAAAVRTKRPPSSYQPAAHAHTGSHSTMPTDQYMNNAQRFGMGHHEPLWSQQQGQGSQQQGHGR